LGEKTATRASYRAESEGSRGGGRVNSCTGGKKLKIREWKQKGKRTERQDSRVSDAGGERPKEIVTEIRDRN